MFNKYFGRKVRNKIINYVKINYNKIDKEKDMILGDSYYNRKCHLNAVQYVKQNKADSVYLCIAIDNCDFPVVHFINKKDNKYVDNTLGWTYEYGDYYVIRKIDNSEYKDIDNILGDTKDMLLDLFIHRFTRKIFKLGCLGI